MLNKQISHHIGWFFVMVVATLAIHHFDVLSWLRIVFDQFEIFFHEISHGYMSLAVGGTVSEFEMTLTSGQVLSSVPVSKAYLVALAGYFGASVFGLLLYLSSNSIFVKVAKVFMLLSCLYWMIFSADWLAAGILVGIMLAIILAWRLGDYGVQVMRFVGVYVMVSSIYSPTYLFSIGEGGDHVNLANMTGLPVWMFITLWILFGMVCLALAFWVSLRNHDTYKNELPTPVSVS